MTKEKNIVGEVVHDLTNPETERTYQEDNLQRQHKIPIGALVEIRHDLPQPEDGFRLHVVQHTRDCDGEPLYSLGRWSDDEGERGYACLTALDDHGYPPKLIWHGCGYGEESLRVIGVLVPGLPESLPPVLEATSDFERRLTQEKIKAAIPFVSLQEFSGPFPSPPEPFCVPEESISSSENIEAAVSRGIVEAFKLLMPLMMPPPKTYIVKSQLTDETREQISEMLDTRGACNRIEHLELVTLPDYESMWSDLKVAINSAEYPVMQELVKMIELQHGVEADKGLPS